MDASKVHVQEGEQQEQQEEPTQTPSECMRDGCTTRHNRNTTEAEIATNMSKEHTTAKAAFHECAKKARVGLVTIALSPKEGDVAVVLNPGTGGVLTAEKLFLQLLHVSSLCDSMATPDAHQTQGAQVAQPDGDGDGDGDGTGAGAPTASEPPGDSCSHVVALCLDPIPSPSLSVSGPFPGAVPMVALTMLVRTPFVLQVVMPSHKAEQLLRVSALTTCPRATRPCTLISSSTLTTTTATATVTATASASVTAAHTVEETTPIIEGCDNKSVRRGLVCGFNSNINGSVTPVKSKNGAMETDKKKNQPTAMALSSPIAGGRQGATTPAAVGNETAKGARHGLREVVDAREPLSSRSAAAPLSPNVKDRKRRRRNSISNEEVGCRE